MYRIARKLISALVLIPLILLIALASGCGLIGPETTATATPLPPAATATSPTATSVTAASNTSTAISPVAGDLVELSVLIEPLDVGYVEVVGSKRLSNGDATEVDKNEQINLIARPVDSEQWQFDRWGNDLQGNFAAETLVMDSPKKIRAFFVPPIPNPNFYGVTVNGQPVRNLIIGVENGSIEISPAPGPGEYPFREGTIVSLTPRPDEGFKLSDWDLDCDGSGPCVLSINDHKEVIVSFEIITPSLTVAAQPAAGGSTNPAGITEYDYGNRVSVTAQPSSGYLFTGFSGDCSESGSCSVLMDQHRSVQPFSTGNRLPHRHRLRFPHQHQSQPQRSSITS